MTYENHDKINESSFTSDFLSDLNYMYHTPPRLEVNLGIWDGAWIMPDGTIEPRTYISGAEVEASGDWGEFDGNKIAKAVEKTIKRELSKQAKAKAIDNASEKTRGGKGGQKTKNKRQRKTDRGHQAP